MPHIPNFPVSPSAAQWSPLLPRVAMQAVLAASILALCPLAQAQSDPPEPPYGMSGRFGLGVATMPTYEGSPDRRTLAVPDLTLSYRSHDWGTVEFGQRGLTWTAVEAGAFRFALVAQFDPGRKDKNPSALDPTPGDKRLSGMGKVKSSTEAGVGIGYGPVMLVARQSLSDRDPKGVQADLSAGIPWALSNRLTLHFAASATWANRDTMQTYFGVTPAHHHRPRVPRGALSVVGRCCCRPQAPRQAVDRDGLEHRVLSGWTSPGTAAIPQVVQSDTSGISKIAAVDMGRQMAPHVDPHRTAREGFKRSVQGWLGTFELTLYGMPKLPSRSFTCQCFTQPLDHPERPPGHCRPRRWSGTSLWRLNART